MAYQSTEERWFLLWTTDAEKQTCVHIACLMWGWQNYDYWISLF
jgi:hypothetical protein